MIQYTLYYIKFVNSVCSEIYDVVRFDQGSVHDEAVSMLKISGQASMY